MLKQLSSIKSYILLLSIMLVGATSVAAQSEAELKRYFEGRQVVLRIDMPATKDGVNVYPEREQSFNYSQYAQRLKDYGASLRRGDVAMITKIKVKDNHIEFQLDGGGYGTFGDETSPSVYVSTVSKTRREKRLEEELKNEPDGWRRRRMREELDFLRREREREDQRNRAEAAEAEELARQRIAERRLQGGSRFNIQFDGGIKGRELTAEDVMEALAEYVYFSN